MQTTQDTELSLAIDRLTSDNRSTVMDIARKLLTLQSLENPDAKALEEINLTDYIPSWCSYLQSQGRSPDTIRVHNHYVKALLVSIPKPTPILIEAYLATKAGPGIPVPSTINRINAYQSFFSYLTSHNILLRNPAEHLQRPKITHNKRESPDQAMVCALFQLPGLSQRERTMLYILVGCGVRATELVTLRLRDVDLYNSQISVLGKGNKHRTIPLPPETASQILLYTSTFPPDARWLFPSSDPTNHLTKERLEAILRELCDDAKIDRITPHSFRHFYTSKLLGSGVDLLTVSQLLGHSGPDVTARVYWHQMVAGKHQQAIAQHNPLTGLIAPSGNLEEEKDLC